MEVDGCVIRAHSRLGCCGTTSAHPTDTKQQAKATQPCFLMAGGSDRSDDYRNRAGRLPIMVVSSCVEEK
jgi:hypothetical protein